MPPVGSVGFPTNYPYAQSMPLPSAILRPLQQPLYDTENWTTTTVAEIIFFQRQLGQSFAQGSGTKSEVDTNLQQPGQLANPLEFSLFGFTFEVDTSCSIANFRTLYNTTCFIFTYTGNRVYLQIPLLKIPQGVGPEGFGYGIGATTGQTLVDNSIIKNGVGHVSNLYKFTIGRSALRIRPTESFQIKVRFSTSTGSTTTTVRCRVYIHGLQWTPL